MPRIKEKNIFVVPRISKTKINMPTHLLCKSFGLVYQIIILTMTQKKCCKPLSLPLSLSLSTHTHTTTHTLSLSLSLSLPLSLSLFHLHTHTNTHYLSLSHCPHTQFLFDSCPGDLGSNLSLDSFSITFIPMILALSIKYW